MTLQPRMRTLLLLVATATAVSSSLFFVQEADAVSTRSFRLDSAADLSGGELDGVMVHSDGYVSAGVARERVDFEGVPIARCVVPAPGGGHLVGTGHEGKVYRVRGDETAVFAETGQLMVASCATRGSTLFAGTIPEGRVFAINMQNGETRELAQLPDAEHVWSLAVVGDRLFAGTGPEGKIFAINTRSGAVSVRYDSEQGHILSLAADGQVLYAGTDGDALVYRLEGNDTQVVHDFEGNEITALAARDGVLAVAANDMPAPRRATTSTSTKAPAKTAPPRPGKGRYYRVDGDGRVERFFSTDSEHFTSVQIDEEGAVYLGSGKEGRVYRVASDRSHSIWLDIDERQVLAMDFSGASPVLVTGDSAALYRTRPAAAEAVWLSKVLDATYRSRFGQLEWRGSGSITLSTRSGNTAEPDETWSEWSQGLTTAGPVRSPAARYIQVRAVVRGDARLRGLDLFYLPQNQRAAVGLIGLKAPSKKQGPDAMPAASTTVPLTWSVTNPDGDALRYWLRFRSEDQTLWRDMFGDDTELTATNYSWDTSALPDGLYVVEVRASDLVANPADLALTDRRESEVIRVDNHAPVVDLNLRGRTLAGDASDSLGPIRRLEWALDGGDFQPVFPSDGLLDEAREAFEVDLRDVPAGSHIFALRAYDAGGNASVAEVTGTLR